MTRLVTVSVFLLMCMRLAAFATAPVKLPPASQRLLESQGFSLADARALTEAREVVSRARLDQVYSIKNAMVVHAGIKRTRDWISRFDRFAGLVPYVDRSDWNAATGRLELEGGIWKYFLKATLQFREISPERWEFEVVEGHFLGMKGFIQFETAGPGRTLVVFAGSHKAKRFPPRWVIERGAEIVFAVTGRRVRSLIESEGKDLDYGRSEAATPKNAPEIPRPRKRLGRSE